MNLKPLHQVIIQGFNKVKDLKTDTIALIYTCALVALFFISGILGILNYFFIKILLFLALIVLLVYSILIIVKNKNHPD